MTVDGLVKLIFQQVNEVIHSEHREILRLWSPQLWKVLDRPMRQFIPNIPGAADAGEKVSKQLLTHGTLDVSLVGRPVAD